MLSPVMVSQVFEITNVPIMASYDVSCVQDLICRRSDISIRFISALMTRLEICILIAESVRMRRKLSTSLRSRLCPIKLGSVDQYGHMCVCVCVWSIREYMHAYVTRSLWSDEAQIH